MVTFLFTDIEGSTRQLALGEEHYRQQLQLHDRILGGLWREFGGHTIESAGDSTLSVFAEATQALRAALAAQLRLTAAVWPGGQAVRVRIGIHTGFARPHDGRYTSLALHQCARIVNAAHGGQILLSGAAFEACPPAEQRQLEALGNFRVRDFDAPVALYRASAAAEQAEQALPPRVRPWQSHNLVRSRSPFIGREACMDELSRRLVPGALTTIVAAGGMGKTRLAIELGWRQIERWPDGVWLVALESLQSAEALEAALLEALALPPQRGRTPLEVGLEFLASRQALLILDNCEHLHEAAAHLVDALLCHCPRLAVLATSQLPLRLRGETLYRLPPLSVPDAGAMVDFARSTAALSLFLELAFELPAGELQAAAQLCQKLEGSPLAIELAAARARFMPPSVILAQFDAAPDALQLQGADRPQRHHSLQRLVQWSLNLLDPAQRDTLARLSLLAASFDLQAAQAICGHALSANPQLVLQVYELLERCLLQTDNTSGETRFVIPANIRRVAAADLSVAQRRDAWLQIGQYYLERFAPRRKYEAHWSGDLNAEYDNVRAVCLALAELDQPMGLALAWSLVALCKLNCSFAAGVADARLFLVRFDAQLPERAGLIGEYVRCLEEMGDLQGAEAMIEEGEALSQATGVSPHGRVNWAQLRALVLARGGQTDAAYAQLQRAWQIAEDDGSRCHIANSLAITMSQLGDHAGAREQFLRAREHAGKAGLETTAIIIDGNLAEAEMRCGNLSQAAAHQARALEGARLHDRPRQIAFAMLVAGRISSAAGDHEQAAALCVAGMDMLQALGVDLYADDKEAVEQVLDRCRASDSQGFERAQARSWSRCEAARAAEQALQAPHHASPEPLRC